MMRRLYGLVLQTDHELRFAVNGVEALDLAAQEPRLDLFIVDINMPQMDGLEFVQRLRGELGIDSPVLVSSTESTDEDREAAHAAGATAFLRKPWTPTELRGALKSLLEKP